MNRLSLLMIPLVLVCLVFSISCVAREYEVTESYADTMYRTETHTEIINETQEYLTPDWKRYAPMYFKDLEWAKSGAQSSLYGYKIDASEGLKNEIKLILTNDPQSSLWGIFVVDLTGIGAIPEPPSQSGLAANKMIEGEMKYTPGPSEQQWLDNFNEITTNPDRFLSYTRSDKCNEARITVDVSKASEFAIITCRPPTWLVSASPIIEKVLLISYEEKVTEEKIPYRVTKERTVIKTEKVPIWEVIFSK